MTTRTPTDALATAGIPPERWGRQRLRPLSGGERAFYRWILTRFAAGSPPGPLELADAASELDLEVEPALQRLAREDLVHHDLATRAIPAAASQVIDEADSRASHRARRWARAGG
jgi:hypothetical protein